ncbi:hypothetical protein A5784_14695 [Mycobacterium sp. 852013-50091_SCH5140682]|uniref:hypothetical protein n=1 Tax=Mycobacterium sp. 852013-50091_SCH5140682 TaxID=1834109 RepID=UPI0007EB0617|nr:hypothetical protein [Mycobacterium sp. 852013-50091_SCH5140682]OBC03456.1 hypothetical protein A5784_14695 [Mycobacterium sp. 852013-50091_SCH5140682]
MTEQSFAVTPAHPSATMLRVVNPAMRLLLHTPLAGPMRNELMVVTVHGRKTGRQYAIPLSAHHVDNTLYALTEAAWKNNFRDGAPAEVLYNGKTTTMHGELIEDRATVADLFERCAQSYGAKRAQRMMGLAFRDQRIPTLEEFTEAVDRLHLAAVKLTPAE